MLTAGAKVLLMVSSLVFSAKAWTIASKGCPCPDAAPLFILAAACGLVGSFLGKDS